MHTWMRLSRSLNGIEFSSFLFRYKSRSHSPIVVISAAYVESFSTKIQTDSRCSEYELARANGICGETVLRAAAHTTQRKLNCCTNAIQLSTSEAMSQDCNWLRLAYNELPRYAHISIRVERAHEFSFRFWKWKNYTGSRATPVLVCGRTHRANTRRTMLASEWRFHSNADGHRSLRVTFNRFLRTMHRMADASLFCHPHICRFPISLSSFPSRDSIWERWMRIVNRISTYDLCATISTWPPPPIHMMQ